MMPVLLDTALTTRPGLPPHLRVLVEELPRLTWEQQPNFGGLAAFWLDRHLDFRHLTTLLQTDTESLLDGGMSPDDHAQRLAHYGTSLLQSLHGHHQIEDDHYFPMMTKMDPRVTTAFTLLDADHHALDALIAGFADAANAVLQTHPDAPQKFHANLLQFNHLLIRHLEDEEDIVIPIILRHGLG